jgi:alginate O-acetyltransferase complex protein AlgI
MSFISLDFIVLMVGALLAYYLAPDKYRIYVLLLFSSVFIGYYHLSYLLIAIVVALFAYGAGVAIEKTEKGKWHGRVYTASLLAIIGFWIFCRNATSLLGGERFLFPLGISFYSFQAIAYLTEIYWEEERAERNLPAFLLYMMFFLKFVSGPIERPADLLPQIKKQQQASYEMMTFGMKLLFIGLVKKLVIADRLAPFLDTGFDAPQLASSEQLLMSCLIYPIYLYADFSGYTDMAIGGARLFGLNLSPNFNRPFISQSTSELWRRWHMSLSFWVRDYIFMPLSSVCRRWGEAGIIGSSVITFVLLGVWHGVGITFVIYGLIQGLSIAYEMMAKGFRQRVSDKVGKKLFATWSVIRMYLIFAFSLIFFRCPGIKEAWCFVCQMFQPSMDHWEDVTLGMPAHFRTVVLIAIVLMFVYEYCEEKYEILKKMEQMKPVYRWSVYYVLFMAFLAFGKMGADNFVYVQF